ncbi:ACT domain-containing protein [Brassicibacter mesophilus]|uniref:ACT domain-containing protein n=1 Tax=Brassicibacter mesophilus TaxID=745119 RepID=UPI003D1B5E92
MTKTLYACMKNGTDSLLRVVSILRRKEFDVRNITMESKQNTGVSALFITIDEKSNLGIAQAIKIMNKLTDISEIKEI